MLTKSLVVAAAIVLSMPCVGVAETQPAGFSLEPFADQETLTNNWFGAGESLEEAGIAVALGLTQVYQLNLDSDNTLVHRRSGRYTGNYNLEMELDFEKLIELPGLLYIATEGSWSDGLDNSSIGSLGGVNAKAAGDRSIDVNELYYEVDFLDASLRIRLGKLDLTGGFECRGCPVAFDGNAFANDGSFQFLNGSLENNPTIPFPDKGLGAIVYWQPLDWAYFAAGVADANADARETGFNTAFHSEADFMGIWEAGVAPLFETDSGDLQGTYRMGLWYSPLEGLASGVVDQEMGFYISADQKVLIEADTEDQGLGIFFRYGYAPSEASEITNFYSIGCQYQGLIPSRDEDILGLGYSYGDLSEDAGAAKSNEQVYELYYNIAITPWLRVSPDVQVIRNAGGADANALVTGVRAQLTF